MATIEDITDAPPELEDAPPALEENSKEAETQEKEEETAGGKKQSKYEKKNKKALTKAGLKPFPGVAKVQLKSNGKNAFIIDNPEVFRGGNSDTWIVFGTPKADDSASKQTQLLQQLMSQQAAGQTDAQSAKVEEAEEDEEGEVDETGLVPSEIEMVMKNANVSRAKAVREIRKNDGDIVNTIMNLQKLSI
ncbi:nascent polypeptide-associated complex subunit alpha [Acrasis kona]|uniref:Nascent polypeptide-associated complex subunit alpha n=1 Tax=Acrasis kona TaxID=1008807 RepID=A0AAW2Z9F9_9EUKA